MNRVYKVGLVITRNDDDADDMVAGWNEQAIADEVTSWLEDLGFDVDEVSVDELGVTVSDMVDDL